MIRRDSFIVVVLVCSWGMTPCGAGEIHFELREDRLAIRNGDAPVASYVFRDDEIPRPYFCNVFAPCGVQVTRRHPPHGDDLQDHATFHPGIWLAFGDLSGNDFWRLKAEVEHAGFLEEPRARNNTATFTVCNRYLSESGEVPVCQEACRYELREVEGAYILTYDSLFRGERTFVFGDQEEMGLGVRLATPIAENQGREGLLTDSAGRTTAGNIRGRRAAWCDYSGLVDRNEVGITVLAHPDNFRDAWWHARDYGFVAANPFGRKALTGGEASRIEVPPGEELRLRFAVVIHDGRPGTGFEPHQAYESYVDGAW